MSAEKSSSAALTFLSSANAEYISHLYGQYLNNPLKVDESWRGFFEALNDNEAGILKEMRGASWTPDANRGAAAFSSYGHIAAAEGQAVVLPPAPLAAKKGAGKGGVSDEQLRAATLDSINALMLIRAYRARGHLLAQLDPLELKEKNHLSELDPSSYNFSDGDYDRPIFIDGAFGMQSATLRDILDALRQTYCGSIGVEFLHMVDPEQKAWIQERIEGPRNQTEFSAQGKKAILQRLTAAETFERFLNTKYQGTKRFGLDGGESAIPAIEQVLKRGGELGLQEVIVGMAHRGRLNVLTNVMGKPFTAVFSEFQGNPPNPNDVQGSGDVKYHLGTSTDRDFNGNVVHLSLTANPSHLEFVDPVVVGKVRAKQAQRNDEDRTKVMPILIHGDAAFAGQGLVAETLMLSELAGYRVGGTVHIIINNQIGFTTMPKYSRSGPYCTDMAKMLSAPIFHVNGDDPEATVHVARIATEFRQQFKKDVVIDMFCYRRYGHNEGDEPAFTQPLMYKKIRSQQTTRELYSRQLIGEGVITEEESVGMIDEFHTYLEQAYEATKSYKPNKADFLEGAWSGLKVASGDDRRGETGLSSERFKRMGKALTAIPEDFNINPKIARQFESKKAMFDGREGFDWATAESLAFASLADQGSPVRLSGQDVGRGTFSQRHAILYDQETEKKYLPLQHISDKQGRVEIVDSPLSEAAVLGFEYGYTLADPRTLVMWEAQFGDFVNGAQGIIDEFISSAEAKWLRMSGLVLLLPHGFEGQGPDHSSARLERFLQMCAEDNWQVCNLTTPANYFHALRRQIVRDFRKPLIIMTPKSLLRHKLAVSDAADFQGASTFHRVLFDDDRDSLGQPESIRRVVLCSGKVYYDLLEERRKRELKDVVLLRVEQLYPFPNKSLGEELARYKNADIVWCQEEPRNMGSWSYINEKIESVLMTVKHKTQRPHYAGRAEAASPATGLQKRHAVEQAQLVNEALTV